MIKISFTKPKLPYTVYTCIFCCTVLHLFGVKAMTNLSSSKMHGSAVNPFINDVSQKAWGIRLNLGKGEVDYFCVTFDHL